ncbi:ABC transporter ATP-binding protein [Plasticicumulans acidivorans]|uniref:Amino acid/amide ABC transporter ATP-binding protein 1 (HAAT family) n=1 Tax=Plasticicumulans acidivorans TaxID=886464 RepID=A0A317MVJ2_9GAMM|nr:ABC transporter ATP-binding protein [Plasticicumulans acidivorans]PWV62267.1 amino acid/amide ABC transporter ATP-binding protein 1 (HAAT family) [Plasticicumulans acidivorans]
MNDATILLRARGLTMRFGGVVALNELDLDVQRGEVLGLLGPNGSGKTTFFNVITGLYAPSAGQVRFADTDLFRASPQQVCRAGIARTFQRSRLCLPLSVFDNLMLGCHIHLDHGLLFNLLRRRRFEAELTRLQRRARELLATFSPALADRLYQPVGAISMIDRRRIEVCRALISDPRLLLLDEPSAGMTHDEADELLADVLRVRAGLGELAIVLIEHEMGLIERVTDRCVVFNYGRKICEGSYRTIAADPWVQEAYLGQG